MLRFIQILCVVGLAGCSALSDGADYLAETFDGWSDGIGDAVGTGEDAPVAAASNMGREAPAASAAKQIKQPKAIEQLEAILAVPVPKRDRNAIRLIQTHPHRAHPYLTDYLNAHAASLPPLVLYELAGRTYPYDRWKGVQWYYAARARLAYDVLRCTDASTRSALAKADDWVGGPLTQIRLNPPAAYGAALAGLDWDKENSIHTITPLPSCLSGDAAVRMFGIDGITTARRDKVLVVVGPTGQPVNPDSWIKPLETHPALLAEARLQVRREVERLPGMSARLPKEWDD